MQQPAIHDQRKAQAPAGRLAALERRLVRDAVVIDQDIREGRFQKALSLIAGLSSVLSGLEVTYQHYRGSYSQRVMYTPVLLSPALLGAGLAGYRKRGAAETVLPGISAIVLADSVIGFIFHVRGIHRKPGGWRLPVANIIMGPPLFAPLLFGISGYLGVLASFLKREEAPAESAPRSLRHRLSRPLRTWLELRARRRHAPTLPELIREGRFQKHLAASTAAWSFFSGAEALYSHYKSNFKQASQWSPIVSAVLLIGASCAAVKYERAARTALPAASLLAIAVGMIGTYYHVRGVLRRPGGIKVLPYNITYGPPLFAPLLFGACGSLGLLASLLRRES